MSKFSKANTFEKNDNKIQKIKNLLFINLQNPN